MRRGAEECALFKLGSLEADEEGSTERLGDPDEEDESPLDGPDEVSEEGVLLEVDFLKGFTLHGPPARPCVLIAAAWWTEKELLKRVWFACCGRRGG